jgi:hypothetical protein
MTKDKAKIKNEPSTQLTELDYYRLIYDESKKSNQTYVSLIQWVIVISFTFLLAIIGSQIFFNYRINKKEVEYIKKDLEERLTKLKEELLESIEQKFSILKKDMDKQFDKSETQLTDKLFKLFEGFEKMADARIELAKNTTNQKIKVLEKEVEKNAGDLWKLKGVESNALSSFLRSAFIQIELKHEVKYLLDDIIEVLNNLEEITSSDYKKLNELLEIINISYKTKADKIKSLYKDKPVYEFVNSDTESPFRILNLPRIKYIKNKK